MVLRRLCSRVDADLGHKPFPLTVPIVDGGGRNLDVAGNNQRGDVGQNISLEKFQVIMAEGFNRRIESQAAMDQFGDCLDDKPVKLTSLVNLHSELVLTLLDMAHG